MRKTGKNIVCCNAATVICFFLTAWSPNPRHDRQVENHCGPLLVLDHWKRELKAIMEV